MSYLRKFLERLSTRLEERRIEVNGELYLQRYYLFGRMPPELAALWNCGKTPKPRLRWLPTVYLHRFHLPDPDRYCHNHPWWGRGMVLTGGYQELRLVNDPGKGDHFDYRVRTLKPGDIQSVTPKTFHRVQKLHADQVWTVFMVGNRVQKWGYNIPGRGFVPYNEIHADSNTHSNTHNSDDGQHQRGMCQAPSGITREELATMRAAQEFTRVVCELLGNEGSGMDVSTDVLQDMLTAAGVTL